MFSCFICSSFSDGNQQFIPTIQSSNQHRESAPIFFLTEFCRLTLVINGFFIQRRSFHGFDQNTRKEVFLRSKAILCCFQIGKMHFSTALVYDLENGITLIQRWKGQKGHQRWYLTWKHNTKTKQNQSLSEKQSHTQQFVITQNKTP